jgi:transcriptional regulator with XRE-family HTH domain
MSRASDDRTERQRLFGDRVRRFRHELGLSQEQLAFKASIDRTYVASVETGRRNPSLDIIGVFATALEVDAADLVRGVQEVPGRDRSR